MSEVKHAKLISYDITYIVEDRCKITMQAHSEQEAKDRVMSGDFEEDSTYEFLDARIVDVVEVTPK